MDKVHQLVRDIRKCRVDTPDKLCVLIGKLKTYREVYQDTIEPDLFFHGMAVGLEKVSDYRIYHLHSDKRLNELDNKIEEIKTREGLGTEDIYERGDPDSPEDYQALNIELQHRIDEISAAVMKEFEEEEMADLFFNKTKEYTRRYHSGWRILEKDNPGALKEIDESEKDEQAGFL